MWPNIKMNRSFNVWIRSNEHMNNFVDPSELYDSADLTLKNFGKNERKNYNF